MRIRVYAVIALVCALQGFAALAQNQPSNTVRTLLAAGRVGSVVDAPLIFRLLAVRLAATQRTLYSGPYAMLYAPSGNVSFTLDGAAQSLGAGAGAFIPAGRAVSLSPSGPEPANFLLFVLSPAVDAQKPLLGTAATVEELYRSAEPLPGLQPGPYEYSLAQVAIPPRTPINPPHYRSGAVLYYVAGGAGLFTADGKTDAKAAGIAHFERAGWVHQWANPGDTPLVLIQANISQEGVPAVIVSGAK